MPRIKRTQAEIEQGQPPKPKNFLIVWHDKMATMIVGSPTPTTLPDLEIPPYQKVTASDEWLSVAHFVRDVADGVLHTERSTTVPKIVKHEIDPQWDSVLDANQKEFVKTLCGSETVTPQLLENIQLHKLMGPGGVPKRGVKVRLQYLREKQRPMLQAAIDLEKTWKNRPELLKVLDEAILAIDAF
jgi:hypothetical protein